MLAELLNYIMHKWLIASSDSLFMPHQLLTQLICFCSCKYYLLFYQYNKFIVEGFFPKREFRSVI